MCQVLTAQVISFCSYSLATLRTLNQINSYYINIPFDYQSVFTVYTRKYLIDSSILLFVCASQS